MICNHDKQYVHVSIPRTASTFMNSMILSNQRHPEPHLHHMPIDGILELHPEAKDYFKFTFVRHPLARLVSLFFEFTKNRITQYSEYVYNDVPLFSEFFVGSDEVENFRSFCMNFEETAWKDDIFLRPQWDFISIDDEMVMNFIGKQESLEKDWVSISERVLGEPAKDTVLF